jgi:hypothetical protein
MGVSPTGKQGCFGRLAVEAVSSEPVSVASADFPETRENTGKLADSGSNIPQFSSRKCPESGVSGFNSLQIRTGNFSARTAKTINGTGTCGRFKSAGPQPPLPNTSDLGSAVPLLLRLSRARGEQR